MSLLRKIDVWKENPRYQRFQQTLAPKLLSILFAVMFWLYVMDQVNPEMITTIPNVKVELLNIDSIQNNGLIMMGDKNFFVDVKVKGRRSEVIKVTSNDLLITADLDGFSKGTNNVLLNSKVFVDSVSIQSLSMNSIKIMLDRIVEIPKPVKVEYTGVIAENYTTGDLSVAPEEIMVKGPESIVNMISSIRGEIDLTTVSNQLMKEIPVAPVDLEGNVVSGVEISRNFVTIQLGVFKLSNVPVEIELAGRLPEGYKLVKTEVLPALVTIRGDEAVVETIGKIKTTAVDLSGRTETEALEVALVMPDGVSAPFAEETVSIRLVIEPLTVGTLEFELGEIAVENMGTEFNYEIFSTGSNVVVASVQDGKSIVEGLSKAALSLAVDVADLTEGEHRVAIRYIAEGTFHAVTLTPDTVLVRVVRR